MLEFYKMESLNKYAFEWQSRKVDGEVEVDDFIKVTAAEPEVNLRINDLIKVTEKTKPDVWKGIKDGEDVGDEEFTFHIANTDVTTKYERPHARDQYARAEW